MTEQEIHDLRAQLTPQRMLVTYTDDQKGQDIREEDVVRPFNHVWSGKYSHNDDDWGAKSKAECPTYGSCQHCYRSGPVGMFCYEHREETPKLTQYMIVRVYHHLHGFIILDSINIAEMLGVGHETAKADRTYAWLPGRHPVRNFDPELLEIRAKQMYKGMDPEEASCKVNKVLTKFCALEKTVKHQSMENAASQNVYPVDQDHDNTGCQEFHVDSVLPEEQNGGFLELPETWRHTATRTCVLCKWKMRERECETCNFICCPNNLCRYHTKCIHTEDSIHFPQCKHNRTICLNCIDSPDVRETPIIYFCASCSKYKCAQCNFPRYVYPLTPFNECNLEEQERRQGLAKEPFLCTPCYNQRITSYR